MEAEKESRSATAGTETGVMEGTEGMRYWQFKKEVCADKGWQLRSVEPETYDVLNEKHEKIGTFKSGEGYFPV
mgnify:CR=1 FL=1